MAATISIQAAAERTGLSTHAIRSWERRYQAIDPQRTTGKQRAYTAEDIERLTMLRRAVKMGHSIGRIARFSIEELATLVRRSPTHRQKALKGLAADRGAPFRDEAVDAVEKFDAAALEDVLKKALLSLGFNGLLRLIFAPLAENIGDAWRKGSLTAAHEHFFTAWVKAYLVGLMRQQFLTPLNAPRIVVGTLSGQLHELGALMAAATAANLGWHAIYLGPSLPAHEIAGAALRNEAAAVAISLVYPEDDPSLARELSELASLLPASTRIFVGGRAAAGHLADLTRIGAVYSDNFEEFGEGLDALRHRSTFN